MKIQYTRIYMYHVYYNGRIIQIYSANILKKNFKHSFKNYNFLSAYCHSETEISHLYNGLQKHFHKVIEQILDWMAVDK